MSRSFSATSARNRTNSARSAADRSPIGWNPGCIGGSPVPNSFGSNPFAEQILVHIQLSGNLGDRAATTKPAAD